MKFVFIVFISLFVVSTNQVIGQNEGDVDYEYEEYEDEEISRVYFFEGNFSLYTPIDAFSEKMEKDLLIGFSLSFLMQLQKEKPSFLGIEAFHMHFGSFSTDYDAVVGGEQLVLNGRVASNALGLHFNYRYYPPFKWGRLEPYVEGHLGVKWLYSYLSESGTFFDEEPYDNFDFLTGDWVMTYGGAFGMQIHVSDFYYLNFKSTYHFAISGEYQKKLDGNLEFVDFPQDAFETIQSATNVVKWDVGMTFLF